MTVAQTNPTINEACTHIKILSGDERARALAEAREKARLDWDSSMGDALQEGIGLGRQEEQLKFIRNALREKLPVETIVKLTDLSLEEVKKLATELA